MYQSPWKPIREISNWILLNIFSESHITMDHSDLLNHDPSMLEKTVYGVTAILAVIINLVLCVIIIKGKNSISDKSDVLFVLNIAIAALLTGMRNCNISFSEKNNLKWQYETPFLEFYFLCWNQFKYFTKCFLHLVVTFKFFSKFNECLMRGIYKTKLFTISRKFIKKI